METTDTPDTCSVCGQSFASEDELRSHEAQQHPEVGESKATPLGSSAVRRDPAMGWARAGRRRRRRMNRCLLAGTGRPTRSSGECRRRDQPTSDESSFGTFEAVEVPHERDPPSEMVNTETKGTSVST